MMSTFLRTAVVALVGVGSLLGAGPASAVRASNPVVAVAASGTYTCVLQRSGAVSCWSDGSPGQLEAPPTPTRVKLPGPATAVAGVGSTVCAIVAARAWCWGRNDKGQVGDGTTQDRGASVLVAGLPGKVRTVAPGEYGTCALTSLGTYCWGWNRWGLVGDGTTENRLTPTAVVGLPGKVFDISISLLHACAATDSGAFCWGRNESGELGNGETVDEPHSRPVAVKAPTGDVSSIDTTTEGTCAVFGGRPYCWGLNIYGELGDGAGTVTNSPAPVSLPVAVSKVDVEFHACANAAGALYCWGKNSNGQLGDGTTASNPKPVAVQGLPGQVTEFAVGAGGRTCAVVDGAAYCWGNGPLGDGSKAGSLTPVRVKLPG